MLWKNIYKTEKQPVLVLEDDTYISKRGFKLLKNTNWIPKNAKIIKCERFGNKRHRVLLSPKFKSFDGFIQSSNFFFHILCTPKDIKSFIRSYLLKTVLNTLLTFEFFD